MAVIRGVRALMVVVWTLAGGTAVAQTGDSGSIIGYVIDATGNPLRGVRVTSTSPTQIGGQKSSYTNDEGFFRFPGLLPGVFEVVAEAKGMQTVRQRGVKVGINAPTELTLVMEVTTAQDEVTIVEKATVSTTTANVKEVYDIDFVDHLPHDSRDGIFGSMVGNTAGAMGQRVRGGAANQTVITMDGFNMQGQSPTLKSSAAYEIQSGGYGPQNATAPGAAVNLVTKSGSNKYELEVGATFDHGRLRFFQDETDARASNHLFILNPSVSGPILRDRLWFHVNVEVLSERQPRDRDPTGYFPDPKAQLKNWHKGTAKLTWQVNPRNKVTSVTNWDEVWEWNRKGLGWDADAQEHRRGRRYFTGLIWEALLTDSLLLRNQAGAISVPQHIFPAQCKDNPVDCDHVPAVTQKYPRQQWFNNGNLHERTDLYTFQVINRLEWFASSRVFGEHNVQISNNYNIERDVRRRSVPGDRIVEYNGPAEQSTEYFSNDPRLDSARYGWFINETTTWRNNLSLSDSWRATRYLTINPGVAFVTAAGTNSNGDKIVSSAAWAPTFSAAWDATRDGRTVVRGSVGSYVDVDINGLARHTVGSQTGLRCRWNEATSSFDRDCEYTGGATKNTFGLPCGPQGYDAYGNPCREKLTIPRTWEWTGGAEREVTQGIALGGDLVYRKYANQYENRETNRIWAQSGELLEATGRYRNGRREQIVDLGTPDGAYRRYVGATVGVTKREGRLRARASYTWSRLDGTVFNGRENRWGDIPGRDVYLDGPLPDDHRHEIKATATYQFTRWFSTGVRYNYHSGLPYSRLFRNGETGAFESYRARIGSSTGENINDPGDDRPLRLPDLQYFSAQFRVNWDPLIGHKLETFADVLNLLALRTTTSVGQEDGRDFSLPQGRQRPFTVRFGVQYRY